MSRGQRSCLLVSRSPCLLVLCLLSSPGCLRKPVTTSASPFSGMTPAAVNVRIESRPAMPPNGGSSASATPNITSPVGSQVVLIATATDGRGNPLTKQKIEWLLEGVGSILEVDKDDWGKWFAGPGSKLDTQRAVTYTSARSRRIPAGTDNPADTIVLEPGQTWCRIDSLQEGESKVTVYAPDKSRDLNSAVLTHRWVDVDWSIPRTLTDRTGAQQFLSTSVFRRSDHQGLPGYRVRYRIIDGPPAEFVPGQKTDDYVLTDMAGRASITLAQLAQTPGRNRVAIEIVQLSDQTVVGQGETVVEWQAPSIALRGSFPTTVVAGQDLAGTLTVTNTSAVAARYLTIRATIPDGMSLVSANPQAYQDGYSLVWVMDQMPGQAQSNLSVIYRAVRPVQVVCKASVETSDGLHSEGNFPIQVLPAPRAQLQVVCSGPSTALLARNSLTPLPMPATLLLTVSNIGTDSANTRLRAELSPGLSNDSGRNPVEFDLGVLTPGGRTVVPLVVKPRQAGPASIRFSALVDGQVLAQAEHKLTVKEGGLALQVTGPSVLYVGQEGKWTVELVNSGVLPLAQATVVGSLPPELDFVSASDGGQLQGREVTWSVGQLGPKGTKRMELTGRANQISALINVKARVNTSVMDTTSASTKLVASKQANPTATGNLSEPTGWPVTDQVQTTGELLGLPALTLKVHGEGPIEVGDQTRYAIDVSNSGTLAAAEVQLVGIVPSQLVVLAPPVGPFHIEGQKVIFNPLPLLSPGQTVRYIIQVQGVAHGDARFRAELTSSTTKGRPVVKEHSLKVLQHPYAPPEGQPAPQAPTR